MDKSADVELEVKVRAVTEKAIQVSVDGSTWMWVPKSQVSDYAGSEDLDQNVTSIFVPQWLAEEKGLV